MFVNMKNKCDTQINEKLNCWHFWCRLCSKNNEENKIRIINKDEPDEDRDLFVDIEKFEYSQNTRIKDAMLRYFDINISEYEEVPTHLCRDCYSLLASLMQFSEVVNKAQNMFKYLFKEAQNIQVDDLKTVREQFEFYEDSNYSFKKLLDGFEFELSFARKEEPYEENPLEISGTKRFAVIKTGMIKFSESESEISSYDGSSDSDYEKSRRRAKNKMFNCGKCHSKFETDREYRKHLKTEHSKDTTAHNAKQPASKKKIEQTFNCPHCSEIFKTITKKCLHIKSIHPDQKLSLSDQLDFEAARKRAKNNMYNCGKCRQEFETDREYRAHLKTEHPKYPTSNDTKEKPAKKKREEVPAKKKNDETFSCPHCAEIFKSNTRKDMHIKAMHPDQKSYVCDQCGFGMNSSRSLRQHMITHSDYAPYNCPTCNKNFKQKIGLKRHMEIHDPEKYICPKCGKQLNSRSTLNSHLSLHSESLRHKCQYCGRAFKLSKTLKNHLILHTGLRPYVCDFCGSTFAQGSSCRAHKKRAHPKELAEQEAAGIRTFTQNIPTISALKAFTSKEAMNLSIERKSQNWQHEENLSISDSYIKPQEVNQG